MRLQSPFEVITASLDGEVLAALGRAPDLALTSGDVVRRIPGDRSLRGVRLALDRLALQGIVDRSPAGRAWVYRLNTDHIAAGPIMAIADSRDRLVERIRAAIKDIDGVEYAALFGSAARGEMRADSDLDMLVVHRDAADDEQIRSAIAVLSEQIERWTGNSANVLVVPASSVTRADSVYADIAEDAVTLAGPTSWLTRKLGKRG